MGKKPKKVVPIELQTQLIACYHFDNHLGIKGIEKMIQKDYFFPYSRVKISEFIQACFLCATCRQSKTSPVPEKHQPPWWPLIKNHIWYFDLIEGFARTKNGNISIF